MSIHLYGMENCDRCTPQFHTAQVQLPSQVKAILNQIVKCVKNPDDPLCGM